MSAGGTRPYKGRRLELGHSTNALLCCRYMKVTQRSWLQILSTLGGFVLLASGFSCGSSDSGGSSRGGACTISSQPCPAACSPTLGCVECANNAGCSGSKPICVLGHCEACGTSADCGTGQVCFPDSHDCMPACTSDASCPGDAPHCDPVTHACVGCRSNADCSGDTPVCDPVRAQCSECASNADCPVAAPICNERNGDCVECLVDANCPLGQMCNNDHKCIFHCASNADCKDAGKPYCDVGSGECVQCLANGNCGGSTPICTDNRCVECAANADCPSTVPVCHGGTCVECASNADCAADPLKPICKDTVCVQCDSDAQCTFDPTLTKCRGNVCTAP